MQAGPGLGAPDALLDHHGLGAALAIPIHAASGRPAGAFLAGRRRPVPFEADTIGTLIVAGDRLGAALLGESEGARGAGDARRALRQSRSGPDRRLVASETATRLGAQAVAVFLPDGDGFVLAGGAGLPDDARAPSSTVALDAVTGTRRAFVPAEDVPADPALARCLGTTLRAVLPLAVDEWLVALLAVGSAGSCGTALSPPFEHAAALALRNARLHAESLRTVADAATDAAPEPVAAGTTAAPHRSATWRAFWPSSWAGWRRSATRSGIPRPRRDLAHAEEAAWRVAEGVRRVLGHAPRSGARPAAPVDIGAAVRDSVRATERLWANEGSVPSVTLDLDPVPPVRVHPEELRQALHHLLQNAREAGNDAGSVAISLRWNGATHIELSVADRGRGMDEATRTRADEPFFTTKGPGRLGVGLAVVRTMASRHRGELEIESVPGQGTTVRLRLPAAAGTRIGRAGPSPAPAPRAGFSWSTTTKRCGRAWSRG